MPPLAERMYGGLKLEQRPLRAAAVSAALLFGLQPSVAQDTAQGSTQDVRTIVREQKTSSSTSGGSSSNSQTRGTLIERIVERQADTVELEYDLPSPLDERRGSDVWMFPARVTKIPGEPPVLLNEEEIAVRLEAWLTDHPELREYCGKHVFTWTAIRIDCDPRAVLEAIAPYDLRPGVLEAGEPYQEDGTISPVPLRLQSEYPGGSIYVASLALDPRPLREEEARMRMAVAEMTRQEPLSLNDALAELEGKLYDGTLTVTFQTDAVGRVVQRTRETEITISEPGGPMETRSATDIVVVNVD